MTRRSRLFPGLALVAAAVALAGCDIESEGADDLEPDTLAQTGLTGDTADSQLRELYEARLSPVGESNVSGTATVTIGADEVLVTLTATGLDPETRYAAHIHMNASCDDAGGIMLNLDDALNTPNEGEARGDAYPETDDQGRLDYEATRSLEELRTALRDEGAAHADSLDLGNRVVNVHGPDMNPVACGPLDRGGSGR
jgi:Cu/Zn superoxide dismutase